LVKDLSVEQASELMNKLAEIKNQKWKPDYLSSALFIFYSCEMNLTRLYFINVLVLYIPY
jgi:hypothetical protein